MNKKGLLQIAKARMLNGVGNPNAPPQLMANGGFYRIGSPPKSELGNWKKALVINPDKAPKTGG